MNKKLVDFQGKSLKKGNVVRMLEVPQDLFSKLPKTAHAALRAEVGKIHLIQGYDEYGKIELEYHDEYFTPHTIWVNASCVTRIFE